MKNFNQYHRLMGRVYYLSCPIKWIMHDESHIIIPKGLLFDISVPKMLRWALSPHNRKVLPAAALHDYMLRKGYPKGLCSLEFYRACRSRGVNIFLSSILYISTLAYTHLKGYKHESK